jgi:hypothetical protein
MLKLACDRVQLVQRSDDPGMFVRIGGSPALVHLPKGLGSLKAGRHAVGRWEVLAAPKLAKVEQQDSFAARQGLVGLVRPR